MVTPPYDDHTPICHFDISGICHVTVDGVSQQLEFAEVYIATQQLGTFISSGREQPSWNFNSSRIRRNGRKGEHVWRLSICFLSVLLSVLYLLHRSGLSL